MIKLTALKRLRYPRGPDGKEYEAGQDFVVLSERDAKALTLVRAAKPAGSGKVKATKAPVESKVLKPMAEGGAPDPTASPSLDLGGAQPAPGERRRYMRRDLEAKE